MQHVTFPVETVPDDSLSEKAVRFVRYWKATVISMALGYGSQALMLSLWGLSPRSAAWWSFLVMVVPSYFMNRRWVWEQSGTGNLRAEALPFWAFGFLGVGLALAVATLLTPVTTNPALHILGSLAAHTGPWLRRFIHFDRVWA